MRPIPRWQHQYLGLSALPRILGQIEIEGFFSFSAHEIDQIRSRYKQNHRIAAAIQIGFLRMTGRLMQAVGAIPSPLLKHVGAQLGVAVPSIASLRTIYRRRSTLFEHQAWAMEIAEFQRATDRQLSRLLPFLRNEAQHGISVDALVESGKVWLYQHSFVYPGERPIRDYAREAMLSSERILLALIQEQLPVPELKKWELALLAVREPTRKSHLEWLQEPIRRKSLPQLRERLERIDFLRNLGVDKLDLSPVPIEKLRAYAAGVRRFRPAKLHTLQDPIRTLRLVCFAKYALMQLTDSALLLAGRHTSKLLRAAYDKARVLEVETTLSFRDMVSQIFEATDRPELSDGAFRTFVRSFKQKADRPHRPTRAAAARWLMTEPGSQIRPLLTELRKLDLKAQRGNETAHNWSLLKECYRKGVTELPENADIRYGKLWAEIVEGPDRKRAMRALEASTLLGIRKGLRNGSLWIEHSETFRNRDALLIDPQHWAATRRRRYAQMNLPMEPAAFLDRLTGELRLGLERVEAALEAGEIKIEDGNIRIPRSVAAAESAKDERSRTALFAKIGVVQFPELILQMDTLTGFSREILGRPARSAPELLQIYGGMLAHGSMLDATAVSLMIPELSPAQIEVGMQFFEDGPRVRLANDCVASFQRKLPVTALWGGGTLVSADMMSLDVSRKIWAARLDPKRNVPSVGTYTHLSDFWSLIFDQPIVLNERQAGAAIEGVIRQREIAVERLAVDTHGYTDFAMAQGKFLGFAVCPRFKRLSDRKLHVPRGTRIPKALAEVVLPTISLRSVVKYWDDLIRIAASILTGQTSAVIALARFGSAALGDPIYRAGVALGRLLRSLYLIDYFTSEPLRREINRILVHGESVHQLQRAIHTGSFVKPRGQRHEEITARSGSLTLMTNLCLAWTAAKIQEILGSPAGTALKRDGLEWMSIVSPAHFANINFRGKLHFPFEQYLDRLIDSAQTTGAA